MPHDPNPLASALCTTLCSVSRALPLPLALEVGSCPVLTALVDLRSYLFDAVYENQTATAEFGKASGILGGLWEKVQQRPEEFLDVRTIAAEGVDVAAQDFVAGMTDRFAVNLFERLFIPKPWVGPSVVY